MPVLETFAERLKEIRKEKGMTQDEVASALGCSRMSYVYYENAKRTPDIEFLDKLREYTGLTSEYLLGYTDNKNMDNITIGEELGLDDGAIEAIQKDKHTGYFINYLLAHPNFVSFYELSKRAMRSSASAWKKAEIGFRNAGPGKGNNKDYIVFLKEWNLSPDDNHLCALQAGTLLSDMLSFGRLTVSASDSIRLEAQKRYLKCIPSYGGGNDAQQEE